jgi:hypothetical protein
MENFAVVRTFPETAAKLVIKFYPQNIFKEFFMQITFYLSHKASLA